MAMYRPENDGIDHINAYSKARTKIGRKLTNYSKSPFEHHLFGNFESMEGFWFWLASGKQYNNLRKVYGFNAHELGRVCLNEMTYNNTENSVFRKHIIEATEAKFRCNPDLLQELVNTGDLPIVHYYYDYKERDLQKAKVTYLERHQWQMDVIMDIRSKTQKWMKEKNITDISAYNLKYKKQKKNN